MFKAPPPTSRSTTPSISAFPKANVTGQFSIYGHEVRSGKAKVEKWLKDLGF